MLLSNTIDNVNIAFNESASKVELLQTTYQTLHKITGNLESKTTATVQETKSLLSVSNTLTNERIANMSAMAKNWQTTIDKVESKIEDFGKNVSRWELKIRRDFEPSLEDVKHEFLTYKENMQGTLERTLNESSWVAEQHRKALSDMFSSVVKNVTKYLENKKVQFDMENFKINANVQKLEKNISTLTEKVIFLKMEMLALTQNMSANRRYSAQNIIETSERCENLTSSSKRLLMK